MIIHTVQASLDKVSIDDMARSKRRKEQKKEAIDRLYYQSRDLQSLLANIEMLSNIDKRFYLSGLILTSKTDICTVLRSRNYIKYTCDITPIAENMCRGSLSKEIGDGVIEKGPFIVYKRDSIPHVYILLTHEKSSFLNKVIVPFISKFHPIISRSFISTSYMYKILESFESIFGEEKIHVSRYSSRGWVKNGNMRKRIESEVKWTDKPFRDVFKEIAEGEEWLKSIDFFTIGKPAENAILSGGYLRNKFKIYRDSRFQVSTHYRMFFDRVIEGILNRASFYFQLFNMRERIREENFKPKPIVIQYDVDIFKDKSENRRLIEVLKTTSHTSVSVYHGNPYLHASYVDYQDGSSYDIWVLSNDRIIIVPQMRSTPAALEKLGEAIFTGFREGTIKDFKG